jgi:phosphohistidine swiveling domain-containing protein
MAGCDPRARVVLEQIGQPALERGTGEVVLEHAAHHSLHPARQHATLPMAVSTPVLEDGPRPGWPAKAATLARMAAAGLRVPPGIVVRLDPAALDDPSTTRAVEALSRDGPMIARAALAGEDEALTSAAGLGESIGGLTSLGAVAEAVRRIAEHRDDPWLHALRPPNPMQKDFVIIQRQITTRWLVVAALLPEGTDYVEVHPEGSGALAAGTSPAYAGAVGRWGEGARTAVERTLVQLRAIVELGPHGLDVELVIDAEGVVWVVQARPIVVDLHAGWRAFESELARQGQLERLEGILVLDAEHNPAPLSWAHAWLMQWLAETRPAAGRPTVLAGWLYVRTLPRDLGARADQTGRAPPRPLHEVLHHLVHVLVPEGRRRLRRLEAQLEHADEARTAAALDEALDAFGWMIDQYLGILVPARTQGRAAGLVRPDPAEPTGPLSTRGREAFADVLPAAWDIASPTLAELGWSARASDVPDLRIPDDPAAQATLLGEWDDHLFALGLAPLRRVYRRAGALLEIGDDVFVLDGQELRAVLLRSLALAEVPLEERRRMLERFAKLEPPLRIEDGHPVPVPPTARMRGIGIGRSVKGRVARRRDLQHLLDAPPERDEVVVLPALTAQAAVALRDLGVRAVCCAHGGALSHATLMARELGLSALVGCRGCLDLVDGTPVELDTRLGRLRFSERGGDVRLR